MTYGNYRNYLSGDEYYFVLRSILKAKPYLQPCLTRCRHCRIFFLTHPCCAGRKDLSCPFGCRVAHRKKRDNERIKSYYSTANGRLKKKHLNDRRRNQKPGKASGKEAKKKSKRSPRANLNFNAGIVAYLMVVTSLIEGRRVSRAEILRMLKRSLRQHRLASSRRIDYFVRGLREKPP